MSTPTPKFITVLMEAIHGVIKPKTVTLTFGQGEALKLAPSCSLAWHNKGNVLVNLKQFNDAIE